MALSALRLMARGEQDENSGTGSGFGRTVLILAGVSALVATLLTILCVAIQQCWAYNR